MLEIYLKGTIQLVMRTFKDCGMRGGLPNRSFGDIVYFCKVPQLCDILLHNLKSEKGFKVTPPLETLQPPTDFCTELYPRLGDSFASLKAVEKVPVQLCRVPIFCSCQAVGLKFNFHRVVCVQRISEEMNAFGFEMICAHVFNFSYLRYQSLLCLIWPTYSLLLTELPLTGTVGTYLSRNLWYFLPGKISSSCCDYRLPQCLLGPTKTKEECWVWNKISTMESWIVGSFTTVWSWNK